MKRERLTARMEKAFWVYLFCNPLLDIFNGFYINVIRGIAVYCEWEMNETKWREWRRMIPACKQ